MMSGMVTTYSKRGNRRRQSRGGERGGLAFASLKDPLDAHEQILVVEGLDDVILDPFQLKEVLHPVARRQDDHRDLAATELGVELSEARVAVHHRHEDIEDDEIRLFLRGKRKRLLPVAGGDHRVAFGLQADLHRQRELLLVVRHQNLLRFSHWRPLRVMEAATDAARSLTGSPYRTVYARWSPPLTPPSG